MPRYGREYDLRNVERRGSEDRVGSLDNSSFKTFMIHSPPLRPGPSRIIPINANSEHTLRTGR